MKALKFFSQLMMCLVICTALDSHTLRPTKKESKYLISLPVIHLHEDCSETSPLVSQGIYGHSIQVIDFLSDGWALVETEDGYRGFSLVTGLAADDPRWKTSKRLVQVASIAGLVYPTKGTFGPALLRLPYSSKVELLKDFDSNRNRWLEVQLVDGSLAWMQRGDLEKCETKNLNEVINLSRQFLGLPYIWGGNSSEGFDCSGFIQTLFKQMGILLPRDSRPQATSDRLTFIDLPEKPGDIIFFGDVGIGHVGLYLGEGRFIHSGVSDQRPRINVNTLVDTVNRYQATRRVKEIKYDAQISSITDEIKLKMSYSWKENNPVPLDHLRYIKLNHWGFDGCVHDGELIVHQSVAQEIVEIFGELFTKKYPIEKMLLIDFYEANDDLSVEDNNTSCFCSRPITGSTTGWSYHSFGLAIDINPLLNPYYNPAYKREGIIGEQFLDRTLDCHGIITEEDACYLAFVKRGWKWGRHWKDYVDYQHFYKEKVSDVTDK